ncbi:MAG TPA: hypothetical protein VFR31_20065 [Thermoanaerobaculia bacterium]|nr:hypothetical protein [Thermoanaerobaculia bacterium]
MRDDELLRRYLLGEMETEEENRLEARLIQDPELFEQAEAVEADLLDEYAHGGLSTAQRSRLQRHLTASAATRSQLAMVRTLPEVTELTPVLTGPWWRKELSSPWFRTLAAAMLTIAVLSGGVDRYSFRLQKDIAVISQQTVPFREWHLSQVGKPTDRLPDNRSAQTDPRPDPTPRPVIVQLFQLALSAHRGPGGIEELRIEPGTGRIDFQFPLFPGDESFPSYQVVITNSATDEELIRRDDLHPVKAGKEMVLLVSVEAKKLLPGSYEAAVKGIPAEGEPVDLGFPQFQVAGPEMNPQG